MVALPGSAGVPTLTGPLDLYLGDELLEPEQRIDESPVRHGVVVGLGRPSSQRAQEPRGLVEVRISSGPGAGHVHRLGIGRATLGHGRHCTIRVPELADQPELADVEEVLVLEVSPDGDVTITPDPAVEGLEMSAPLRREPVTAPIVLEASTMSETTKRRRLFRRKRKVMEFQLGERIDPADAVPLVHLDRRPLTGSTPWKPEQSLGVGPLLVDQVAITPPDASLSPSPAGPTLDYNRPPRLHPAAQPNEFSLPQEPRRPDKMPFPLTMMLMPVVMSGAMYFVTRAWYTLLFAAAMPLMMLANASGSRRQQKKRYLEQVKEYEERRVRTETGRGHLARRRTRCPPPQLPRPRNSAALRHRAEGAAVGAAAVGPRLPAPPDRYDGPPVRRDDQGPDPRGPRGPAAVDRPRRAGHHPAARGGRGRHRRQPRALPLGRDVGGGPGRRVAQPVRHRGQRAARE